MWGKVSVWDGQAVCRKAGDRGGAAEEKAKKCLKYTGIRKTKENRKRTGIEIRIDFKPVMLQKKRSSSPETRISSLETLRSYYENCDYGLCEYSLGTKLMWGFKYHPVWAEVAGCLVVRNTDEGKWLFDYPVPGPEGDEDAALDAIEAYCLENEAVPVISVVPECKAARLLTRYPYVQVSDIRTWRDYIYDRKDLQLFAGRRYSGQRNHIKKFRAQWPDAEVRRLTAADAPVIERFWADYEAEFPKGDNEKALVELSRAKGMLKMAGKPWFVAGGMFDGDKLIALALAEKCGETLIIHIEKALYSYTGVYPTFVQAFADAFGRDCQWVNREDDAADKGLRTSKLQYGPVKLAPKYCFVPQNALHRHVGEIPELKTQRLTLSALTMEDASAYNALVQDREWNRWWDFTYVNGRAVPAEVPFAHEVEEDAGRFIKEAWHDFDSRKMVTFAVRLDGKLIGEAVLHGFDSRGGAEVGCRIAPAYAGCGYGTEAITAAADWGLYKVHLSRVLARCFKENQTSFKMLSSFMRRKGEDETFYYFEKLV